MADLLVVRRFSAVARAYGGTQLKLLATILSVLAQQGIKLN